MTKGYIKGLDGLRAIAICWVMFGHISSSLNWPVTAWYQKPFVILSNTGWVGVQLFFVISGFLITGILLKGLGQKHQLRNFYIRRSLRIFPVYYLTLFFFFIALPLFSATPNWLNGASENQLWYWLYLQNWIRPFTDSGGFSPLWSLAIEEQYYLVWPLLVLKLNAKTLIRVCLFMVISAPIFRVLLFYIFPDSLGGQDIGKGAAYAFTFARWDAIAFGSLLALLGYKKDWPKFLVKYSKLCLVIVTMIVVIQIAYFHNFSAVNEGLTLLNQTTAGLLFFLVVFIVYYQKNTWLIKCLEFPLMKYIGKYSYAMYLFHLPIVIIWIDFFVPEFSGLHPVVALCLLFAHYFSLLGITFLLAMLSWNILEHPFLKIKKRFA